MPILTVVEQPPTPPIREIYVVDEIGVAQGPEGQFIRDTIRDVSRHWLARSLFGHGDLKDTMSDHRSVPLTSVGMRRVRYVRVEPLRPRSIEQDEDSA